jgi:phospholipid transport system substrate-binding protein
MKRPESLLFSALLALALLVGGPALADPATDARTAMQSTIDSVLQILRGPGSDEQQRAEIETLAKQRFDFTTMSKLVLKRDWKRFQPAEQTEFVNEFTEYLSASYGTRIARYKNEQVATLGTRSESNGDVTVQTAIKGGQFDGATVDYRMRQIGGKWQVIDVVIEGISLVSNFRQQFADVIAKGGPQELLKRIKAKNDAGVVDAPPTEAPAGAQSTS